MDLLGVRAVPYMARRNYLIELRHMVLWGMFAGMFEGSVSSVVVAKTFDAGPWLIAIVMATPMFANLMGAVWGTLATGRRKLPLFSLLAGCSAAMVASVTLAPPTAIGGWMFAGQILLARMMLSGCVTLRSSLWKHNYPTAQRGRIAAKLQIVRFSLGVATVTTVSLLFDLEPLVYVWVYPLAAVAGVAAIMLLRQTHVRGEAVELLAVADGAGDTASGSGFSPWALLGSVLRVLRSDRRFARYCWAMMLLGSANIMVMPLMTIIITKQLGLSYYHSSNLMEVMPRVLMMGSLLPWANLFDRVGVVRFRVLNAVIWSCMTLFGGIGAVIVNYFGIDSAAAFAAAVTFVAIARLCEGLGRGGGAIAWNLGHLHFAEPAMAEKYMGTHVFLTGLRGLVAPFFGTFLYIRFGPIAFAVATAFALAGLAMFHSMAKSEAAAEKPLTARPE